MINCWVITDGNAGARSQAIGLAEGLGISYAEKKFRLKTIFRPFAPYIPFNYLKFKTVDSDNLSDSKPPKLLIICGSRARAIGPYFKRKYGEKVFTIYIQDPRINPSYYDLVIVPQHDSATGKNVIKTDFALNRINEDKLVSELKQFAPLLNKYSEPKNVILVGGPTKKYKMDKEACEKLIKDISYIINKSKGSVLITPSRRTPKMVVNALKAIAVKNEDVFLYDLKEPHNPFFAMLATADKVFVTNDSVSMVSEAAAAGKNIFVIPLKGNQGNKVARMFDSLLKEGKVFMYNQFTEKLQATPPPINETLEIAYQIKKILLDKKFFSKKDFD